MCERAAAEITEGQQLHNQITKNVLHRCRTVTEASAFYTKPRILLLARSLLPWLPAAGPCWKAPLCKTAEGLRMPPDASSSAELCRRLSLLPAGLDDQGWTPKSTCEGRCSSSLLYSWLRGRMLPWADAGRRFAET